MCIYFVYYKLYGLTASIKPTNLNAHFLKMNICILYLKGGVLTIVTDFVNRKRYYILSIYIESDLTGLCNGRGYTGASYIFPYGLCIKYHHFPFFKILIHWSYMINVLIIKLQIPHGQFHLFHQVMFYTNHDCLNVECYYPD